MSTRIQEVDAGRGLAVLGMMSVHLLPYVGLVGVLSGRASALFVFIMGISAVFLHKKVGSTNLIIRGVLLCVLGLLLQSVPSPIAVILITSGCLLILGTLLYEKSFKVISAVLGCIFTAAPLLSFIIRYFLGQVGYAFQGQVLSLYTIHPGSILEVLVSGYYPLLTWSCYFVGGVLVGRVVGSANARKSLLIIGLGLSSLSILGHVVVDRIWGDFSQFATQFGLVNSTNFLEVKNSGLYGVVPTNTWQWLLSGYSHSGTWLDLLGTLSSAVLIIGVLLYLPKIKILGYLGIMSLTLYTLHIILTSILGLNTFSFLVQLGLFTILAFTFKVMRWQGFMERLLATVSRKVVVYLEK